MEKKKLILSFSMGETSAFMAQWCLENLKDEYEMVVLCANTGEEDEKSLEFANECDKYFRWNMVWLEANVIHEHYKGTQATVVTFETASRNGEPFEEVIKKYGIPNIMYKHCNRELKLAPIHWYVKNVLLWDNYYTAIGIRSDEPSRLKWETAKKNNLLYILATHVRMTKPKINRFWERMPFRLGIKSYEGNCKWCWKKSKRKHMTLAVERPEVFKFPRLMELKYGDFIPESRDQNTELPIRFFTDNESVDDIFEDAKHGFHPAIDERLLNDIQSELWDQHLDSNTGCVESCEPYFD